MYENYTRALQVLDVLERTCEKLQLNREVKLKPTLNRKGLLAEPSVAYLMDSLRPKEAKRFCEAMSFIEGHMSCLKDEDKAFVRTEAPATKGFYMAYLQDHSTIIELARRMMIGERRFTHVDPQLIDVASNLASSPTWCVKVLIPSIDPRKAAIIISNLTAWIYQALERLKGKPAPWQYVAQLQRMSYELQQMRC
ncbi:hypothetical protein [Enterobacter ludwigii]|uniref:hypothetical protein n=1 Tax=Enterobacter cloacae complex TaxID=354276 RepID=UPI000F844A3E|nr:hypothetical protein [Enterobacter ludwigii]RTO43319.1 hypothetical protein EKN74_25460 [Enterobacter ludwigii]